MENRNIPPKYEGPLTQFPKDCNMPAEVKTVAFPDTITLGMKFHSDVVYDEKDGMQLHLQIFQPYDYFDAARKFPIILYVQGSGWEKQNVYQSLPSLSRMSSRGFLVAVVEYRYTPNAVFPAMVEDCKTAIRWMKLHAEEYGGNAEKIALWGDSSGAHTILMAGFTGDSYPDNGTYGQVSCKVNCLVDWFGPSDFENCPYYPSIIEHQSPESGLGMLLGGKSVLDCPEEARKASPISYVTAEKALPSTLIMHGNMDAIVPFNQSVRLYEKMKECGQDVEMICVDGAGHGYGGFSNDGALELVEKYIRRHLKKRT